MEQFASSNGGYLPKKVSSDFSYTLSYLTLKYERNRIFYPCRVMFDFYRQAPLSSFVAELLCDRRPQKRSPILILKPMLVIFYGNGKRNGSRVRTPYDRRIS